MTFYVCLQDSSSPVVNTRLGLLHTHTRTLAWLHNYNSAMMATTLSGERGTVRVDAEAWACLVHNPVLEAVKKRFRNHEDLADAEHATSFILKSLVREMGHMIHHLAFTETPTDFASMVILASVAPKSVYSTVYQAMPVFVERMAKANGLPGHTRGRMQKYLSSLREDAGTRLSLMFIRDAVYLSSPSNLDHIAALDTSLRRDDIVHYTRLLTLAMCSDVLGIPKMRCSEDMKGIASTLVHAMEGPGGCAFISQGDSISKTQAPRVPLSERKTQVVKFLSSLC